MSTKLMGFVEALIGRVDFNRRLRPHPNPSPKERGFTVDEG